MNAHPKMSYGVACDLVTARRKKIFPIAGSAARPCPTPAAPEYFVACRRISVSHADCSFPASVQRRALRLELGHLLDGSRELLGIEGRERADTIAASKSCRLAEIGIFDIGIGQLA